LSAIFDCTLNSPSTATLPDAALELMNRGAHLVGVQGLPDVGVL
jgi:hypothetical protein